MGYKSVNHKKQKFKNMKTQKMKVDFPNNSTKIKSYLKTVMFLLMFTLVFTACSEDEDTTPEQQEEQMLPDGQALLQRLEQNRQEDLQTFSLDAADGGSITGEQGTRIFFPPNALAYQDGSPVTGEVTIELVEIYNKADMLLKNMPTNGKRPDGTIEMIKSAGEFFINATKNEEQLTLTQPMQLQSKGVPFEDVDPDMGLFIVGCDDPLDFNCTEAWEEDEFTQVGMGEVQNQDGTWSAVYLVDLSEFGWTNLDRWYNYDGELTTLNVDVPEGYNGGNCEVYLSYDGEDSGLARMDVYDENTGMFTEHFGMIPVGQEVHIIIIAEINGVLHYTIQGTTITQDHIEVMAEPQPGTEADLFVLIEDLP